jgi:hypothetical protein
MRHLLALLLVSTLLAPSYCQPPPPLRPAVKAGSAEDLRQRQEQIDMMRQLEAESKKARESGEQLFGSDKRWTERKAEGTMQHSILINYKTGDWGNTSDIFTVVSKVNDSECLIRTRQREGSHTLLLRGFDMSKVTDGVQFVLQHPIVIQGTYSYTEAGTKKTVLVMERDERKLTELLAKENAEKVVADAEFAKRDIQSKIDRTKKEMTTVEDRIHKAESRLSAIPKAGFEKDRDTLKNSLNADKDTLAKYTKTVAEQEKQLAELEKTVKERKENGLVPKIDRGGTAPSTFVGRWRIVDEKGVTSCYFTLTGSFEAKKSHAPDVTAKWEVVGVEARITWSDGWRDILRPEKGRILKFAFGPGSSWDDKPANTQFGIKEK